MDLLRSIARAKGGQYGMGRQTDSKARLPGSESWDCFSRLLWQITQPLWASVFSSGKKNSIQSSELVGGLYAISMLAKKKTLIDKQPFLCLKVLEPPLRRQAFSGS